MSTRMCVCVCIYICISVSTRMCVYLCVYLTIRKPWLLSLIVNSGPWWLWGFCLGRCERLVFHSYHYIKKLDNHQLLKTLKSRKIIEWYPMQSKIQWFPMNSKLVTNIVCFFLYIYIYIYYIYIYIYIYIYMNIIDIVFMQKYFHIYICKEKLIW